MILSAYRRDDLVDPKGWNLQVMALLATFPQEVVDYVTDPITGVQSHHKYGVPNLADIREACDERMARLRAKFHCENPPVIEPPLDRSMRPTLEELKAKHGPNWGIRTMADAVEHAKPRSE